MPAKIKVYLMFGGLSYHFRSMNKQYLESVFMDTLHRTWQIITAIVMRIIKPDNTQSGIAFSQLKRLVDEHIHSKALKPFNLFGKVVVAENTYDS